MADVSPFEEEGDLHDPPHGHDHPGAGPETDVCTECDTLVEVLGVSIETAGALEAERHYRVIELACGHQIAQGPVARTW